MGRKTRRLAMAVVATDNTFARVGARGGDVWEGKCLHCKRRLAVGLDGELYGEATIEHIVPRTHGGDDSSRNLAVACARCNRSKAKLDARPADDPKLREVIAKLQAQRESRWRDP